MRHIQTHHFRKVRMGQRRCQPHILTGTRVPMAVARCSWFMRLTCSKYTLKSLPMPRTPLTCCSETCSFFCAAMAMAVLTALRICRPFRFPFFSMSSPTCFKMAFFSASPMFKSRRSPPNPPHRSITISPPPPPIFLNKMHQLTSSGHAWQNPRSYSQGRKWQTQIMKRAAWALMQYYSCVVRTQEYCCRSALPASLSTEVSTTT